MSKKSDFEIEWDFEKSLQQKIGEKILGLLSCEQEKITKYDLFLAHLLSGYVSNHNTNEIIRMPEAKQIIKSLKNIAKAACDS